MKIKECLSFDDVLLEPQYSDIRSRKDVSLDSNLGCHKFTLPIISSPMDTITESKMLISMANAGGLGILHRYNTIEQQVSMVLNVLQSHPWVPVAAAIGVTGDYLERAEELVASGVSILCLDVAHGHHILVAEALREIKNRYGNTIYIIAGNVATAKGFEFLADRGADAVRLGVGSGGICSTRIQTGHGVPLLQNIIDCDKIREQRFLPNKRESKIIADGGMKNSGDIVKALAAGADFVMCGSLLSGTDECPGEVIIKDGVESKIYRGMACFSQDTEILTRNGWKKYEDLLKNEEVATLNCKSNEVEYQGIEEIYLYNHKGSMIRVKSSWVDLLTTPNHRAYVAKRSRVNDGYFHKYRILEAENLLGSDWFFKKEFNWTGKKVGPNIVVCDRSVEVEKWVDFMGFYLAKGCVYTYLQKKKYQTQVVSLNSTNRKLIEHYNKILNDSGFRSKIRTRKFPNREKEYYETICYNRELYNYLKNFGKAHEKYVPIEIKEMNKELIKIFIRAYMLGDGSVSRNAITTNSLKMRDDLMELALKIGATGNYAPGRKKGSTGVINGKTFGRNYDTWQIYFSTRQESFVEKKLITKEQYDGRVWCVSVPNGIVYVRRNGRACWSGNSRSAQNDWRQKSSSPEGISTTVPHRGPVADAIRELEGGIRSGLSYSGAQNLWKLRLNASFVRQTSAGQLESSTHILARNSPSGQEEN